MKINILSDEKIETLSSKENQETIENCIKTTKDNSWINDLFREEMPFTPSKAEMDDLEFDMSKENPEETDFENAKRLFTALKISESTACDERLWLGLSFDKFYDYMKYRFNPEDNKYNYQTRWIMSKEGKKRDLFKQGLSSLWWYAYITYDETLEDPFELTEFCFNHKIFLYSLYYRSFSSCKNVCHALIKAVKDFERDGGTLTKAIGEKIVKYISFLGGAYLLDSFSVDELYEKAYEELIRIDEELNAKTPNRFKL